MIAEPVSVSDVVLPDEVVRVAVSALLPYARNSRTHSKEQVDQLAASIQEFGFTNPVLVDGEGGIIAGHGRVMAAKQLGLSEVPCIKLRHLTEAQKRAYVIADNKLALNSSWDESMLRMELTDLESSSFDVNLLGFTEAEIRALAGVGSTGRGDPDDAPAIAERVTSRQGDTWVLGAHRVRCGDSTDLNQWRALMQAESADCVWTDPPYNVAYESSLAGKIQNDNLSDEQFLRFLQDAFISVSEITKPGSAIYVAHADGEPGLAFRMAFRAAGFKLSGCLIWKKNALVLGRSDYQWIHEPILYGWKPGSKHRWLGGRKQVTVQQASQASAFVRRADGSYAISIGDEVLVVSGESLVDGPHPSSIIFNDKPVRSADHPTMKPVALIERMLSNSALPGDVIADAFGGSGSTLIAAERLGMRARLMELEPRFVDVIVKRWQDYTGNEARHESLELTYAAVQAQREGSA